MVKFGDIEYITEIFDLFLHGIEGKKQNRNSKVKEVFHKYLCMFTFIGLSQVYLATGKNMSKKMFSHCFRIQLHANCWCMCQYDHIITKSEHLRRNLARKHVDTSFPEQDAC